MHFEQKIEFLLLDVSAKIIMFRMKNSEEFHKQFFFELIFLFNGVKKFSKTVRRLFDFLIFQTLFLRFQCLFHA